MQGCPDLAAAPVGPSAGPLCVLNNGCRRAGQAILAEHPEFGMADVGREMGAPLPPPSPSLGMADVGRDKLHTRPCRRRTGKGKETRSRAPPRDTEDMSLLIILI